MGLLWVSGSGLHMSHYILTSSSIISTHAERKLFPLLQMQSLQALHGFWMDTVQSAAKAQEISKGHVSAMDHLYPVMLQTVHTLRMQQ